MNIIERILVLGSNAFTAGHFIDYVLENTGARIVGVSRSPEYDPLFLAYLYGKSRTRRFSFHRIDINEEMTRLHALCDDFRPQVVVNFAAQGEVRNSWRFPEHWYRTNCLGVVRLAEHLKSCGDLQRYVAVSTPEVYGSTGERIRENHTYRPSTPYAASKLAGDLHLFALYKRHGFPVVFTRAANLYGIHQQLYRIIPRTMIYLKLGKTLALHGGGRAQRGFIHARDVADFTWRVIRYGENGRVYHVAPADGLKSIAQVVRFICDMCGTSFDAAVRMVAENYGQDSRFSLSAERAETELGWRQQVAFEEGVRETLAWIEDNWAAIQQQPLDYIHKP